MNDKNCEDYVSKMNDWDFQIYDDGRDYLLEHQIPANQRVCKSTIIAHSGESKKRNGYSFWDNVERLGISECWVWKRSKYPDGYGRVVRDGKQTSAHRMAYELSYGYIPTGMEVCHTCDNKPCCNPFHLFLGTHADNMQDMLSKGRKKNFPRSTKRITLAIANDIREKYKSGIHNKSQLARDFNVSPHHVRDIISGKVWK